MEAVRVSSRYLAAFWGSPATTGGRSTSSSATWRTLGAVHAGLRAAALARRSPTREVKEAIGGIEALIAAEGVARRVICASG